MAKRRLPAEKSPENWGGHSPEKLFCLVILGLATILATVAIVIVAIQKERPLDYRLGREGVGITVPK
jgi:hypothetical protein